MITNAGLPESHDNGKAEPKSPQPGERQVILSEPQRRALEWLTSDEFATVKDAADFAGVARSTVSRWINDDPDFRALYQAWRRQQSQMNEAQMVGLETAALDVITEAIRQRRDLRAAEFIIKQATARRNRRGEKHPAE